MLFFLEFFFTSLRNFLDHKSYFDFNRLFDNYVKGKCQGFFYYFKKKKHFFFQFKDPKDENVIKYEALLRIYYFTY